MNAPWPFKRNSTRSVPVRDPHSSDLTLEQPDTLKSQLGLSILQALDNHAATDETARKRRLWNDLHFAVERNRLNLPQTTATSAEDAMGTTVRIDSNDEVHHHHYPNTGLSGLATAAITAAALLGTGGIGFGLLQYLKPAVETVLTRDADVRAGEAIVEQPKE